MDFNSFKEFAGRSTDKFADCPFGKSTDGIISENQRPKEFPYVERPTIYTEQYDDQPESRAFLSSEKFEKNKNDGARRENEVEEELKEQYPESEGYVVNKEVYLRDKDGNIAKDPETGESRRIDFVVTDKNGNVVDSVEVTSKTADKTGQSAKEQRIRDNGGNYIRTEDGNLVKIPDDVQTRIERRD